MHKRLKQLASAALLGALSPMLAAASVDAKLLEMLRANGSITAEQYAELSGDLEREHKAAKRGAVSKADMVSLEQKLAWAANTQIKGDVRVRQERVDIESKNPSRDRDRQRIRARVGVFTQVNPEVEGGVQIATGNGKDARSTNQDLDGLFEKKDVWLDLAYIDWHPMAAPGMKLFAGKIKQPWVSLGDAIWDGDINPEGVAGTYSRKFGATELFGSAGSFTLRNNVDGDGNQFRHDLRLNSAQAGARFFPGDDFKITLGGSLYNYQNDKEAPNPLSINGNTATRFQLYEAFGQVDVLGLPLPLSVYGQVVKNADANGPQANEDTAWLVGVLTRVWDFGVDYNYRDVERNAVVGAFTDSDFGAGFTASRGHKLKLKYDISKNFTVGATYFKARSDVGDVTAPFTTTDTDTVQIDLEVKI